MTFVVDPNLDAMFDIQRFLHFMNEFPQYLPEVLGAGDESEAMTRMSIAEIRCSRCKDELAEFTSVIIDSERTERWLDQCRRCYQLTRILTTCTWPN